MEDKASAVVTPAITIGYNLNGELRMNHAPGIDPGQILFIIEKIKMNLIMNTTVHGDARKVLPFNVPVARNGGD